ncbi:hypothetical protein ALC53_11925 [Atta colombica]|uniref:Uncharacterized protein n=1 Tax=Atta colombica TaxID=520822 RepID=A0A195B052_9HYME|nr:hypothetical protein ALC53_11925 [Atta colombica]
MPYVRYSRVPIAMWYPLMRVHVLPSVCESPGKTRPTCQYDDVINKKFSKIKENMQTNKNMTATVFKVLQRARLIGTGTTSVKASGALKRKRRQIRFKGPGYIRRRPDRGACIIWGFLGTANE